MAEDGGSTGWDFLTLITGWNLYALPAVLLAAVLFIMVKNRRLGTADPAAIGLDGRRLVRVVTFIQLVLALHGAILLVQELLTMREMGVTESFANFIIESLSVIVYPILALGFWRRWRWARYFAIGWYLFLSVVAVIVVQWYWRYHVAVEPRSWPNQFASKVMPFFLLFVMFLPRVRRVFARPESGKAAAAGLEAGEAKPEQRLRWSRVSLIALLFSIVVVSNLAVDAADWIERSVAEWNQTEES